MSSIKIINGNILDAKTDFILHQVNCQGVMGSGVAKTLRQYEDGLFQHYYLMYDNVTKAGFSLLGLNDYYWWTNHGESQCVVSMFAQDKYGYDGKQYTDLGAFIECLRRFKANWPAWVEECDELRNTTVALPYKIGCGRGGTDWENDIYPIIKRELEDYNVELWRYEE